MKIIMIAALGIALLAGGGGAYFFLNKPAEASAATEHDEAAEAAAKEAISKPLPTAMFVQLDPLTLPVVDENGVSQMVSLVISVEVADKETGKLVINMQPKLKDAFIQDMYGVLSRKALMSGGTLEVAKVKARLNRITQDILGPGVAREVLLQVVQQRRI